MLTNCCKIWSLQNNLTYVSSLYYTVVLQFSRISKIFTQESITVLNPQVRREGTDGLRSGALINLYYPIWDNLTFKDSLMNTYMCNTTAMMNLSLCGTDREDIWKPASKDTHWKLKLKYIYLTATLEHFNYLETLIKVWLNSLEHPSCRGRGMMYFSIPVSNAITIADLPFPTTFCHSCNHLALLQSYNFDNNWDLDICSTSMLCHVGPSKHLYKINSSSKCKSQNCSILEHLTTILLIFFQIWLWRNSFPQS